MALFGASATAQHIAQSDLPDPCLGACGGTLGLIRSCDAQHSDGNSQDWRDCVCTYTNANNELPACGACIDYYHDHGYGDDSDRNDHGEDNPVNVMRRNCSFGEASFSPDGGATTPTGGSPTATSAGESGSSPTQTGAADVLRVQMAGLGAVVLLGVAAVL
ncbi:hypothetical protein EJ05DRAFT_477624 [Pseudovirgaria hyperparasitica]|uniref:Uncharacterized protein n=1 Tax=Pseudovirgaria hyperparasitica TaxID=470096 RepID=A0A6A6W4J7_9PEZI|nr:uncharacterized protein EJ05DRAFT_477624 [Pseudovirgaria hyperparasitica]KAF2756487.1 hypothetical protein EJ05DRAFT_477624 [Pseudovirgaria hyperparasitica]